MAILEVKNICKSFGKTEEVCEAICDMPNTKCEQALYQKAISSGVKFSHEQLKNIGIVQEDDYLTDEEIAEIIRRIEAFDYLAGITFISFSYDNLLKVRAIRPEATCQFLTGDASDEMIARLVGDKLDLDVHHSALTEERIAALHAAGIRVNCWTVDEKERAEQLAAWGVDYITSNILEAEA